jgi:hypothetical protein
MTRDPVPTPSAILDLSEANSTFAQLRSLLTPSPILKPTPSRLTGHHGTGSHPP